MKKIIKNNIFLSIFLLLSLTGYSFAGPALPVSAQMSEGAQAEKIEILQEIKIEAQSTNLASNSKLKEGKACSDENLEEVKGELFTEIPMAETMPCDKVDCNDLGAAKMHADNYKKLNNAKTISCAK